MDKNNFAMELRRKINIGYNFLMLEMDYWNQSLTKKDIAKIIGNHYSETWKQRLLDKAETNQSYDNVLIDNVFDKLVFPKMQQYSMLYYLTIPENMIIQKLSIDEKNSRKIKLKGMFSNTTYGLGSYEIFLENDIILVIYFVDNRVSIDLLKKCGDMISISDELYKIPQKKLRSLIKIAEKYNNS